MSITYIHQQKCTPVEAVKLIRKYRKGRSIRVCFTFQLPIGDDEGHYFPDYKSLEVSVKQAKAFVLQVSPTLVERGGRIDVRVCDNLIFIG